jgi:hypothetical protein
MTMIFYICITGPVIYSYGKVLIHAGTGKYKIGTVSQCEEVCSKIMTVVNEKKKLKKERAAPFFESGTSVHAIGFYNA